MVRLSSKPTDDSVVQTNVPVPGTGQEREREMNSQFKNQIRQLGRAALFAVVTVGGLSLGLGFTTYTVAKANDYMIASVKADSTNPSEARCLAK